MSSFFFVMLFVVCLIWNDKVKFQCEVAQRVRVVSQWFRGRGFKSDWSLCLMSDFQQNNFCPKMVKQSSLFTQGEWTKYKYLFTARPCIFHRTIHGGVQCLAQGHFSGGNFNVPVRDLNTQPFGNKTASLTGRPPLPQQARWKYILIPILTFTQYI